VLEDRDSIPGTDSSAIFLFPTAVSRPALGPTQSPIQWIPGVLTPVVTRPGRKADHSHPSSAENKNAWSYTSIHAYVFMVWCLIKHKDNFVPLVTSSTYAVTFKLEVV
jgi:hypothetical protein